MSCFGDTSLSHVVVGWVILIVMSGHAVVVDFIRVQYNKEAIVAPFFGYRGGGGLGLSVVRVERRYYCTSPRRTRLLCASSSYYCTTSGVRAVLT